MIKERITRQEIETYKREILEQTVVVTIQDAAKMLSCSPGTVRGLIRDGFITQHNRHGAGRSCNGTRILAAELRDYVRSIKIDREKWGE